MQPPLYPVSLQRMPAFSNLSIRFCAVLALKYDSDQKCLSPLCPYESSPNTILPSSLNYFANWKTFTTFVFNISRSFQ